MFFFSYYLLESAFNHIFILIYITFSTTPIFLIYTNQSVYFVKTATYRFNPCTSTTDFKFLVSNIFMILFEYCERDSLIPADFPQTISLRRIRENYVRRDENI